MSHKSTTAWLTDLLFKRTDVPPVESQNIQNDSSVKHIFFSRLIPGQSWERRSITLDKHLQKDGEADGTSHLWRGLPLRSWSSVTESWLFLHDWIVGEHENCSSHPMKDGHAAKPWSREFRKQVLPKFKRPGTMPERQKPLSRYRCTTSGIFIVFKFYRLTLTFLFFLSICDGAPQNIDSSSNCSSNSTNDPPVLQHLVPVNICRILS